MDVNHIIFQRWCDSMRAQCYGEIDLSTGPSPGQVEKVPKIFVFCSSGCCHKFLMAGNYGI